MIRSATPPMLSDPPASLPPSVGSRGLLLPALVLAALAAAVPLRADVAIHTAETLAIAGQPLTVRGLDDSMPLAGARVTVEIRPASQIAETHALGTLDQSGELRFTPEQAGLLRLRLLDPESGEELARHDLAVRYPGVPPSALLVLAGAGGLLFGGVWIGMHRQLRAT